jgi:hypothetical protein
MSSSVTDLLRRMGEVQRLQLQRLLLDLRQGLVLANLRFPADDRLSMGRCPQLLGQVRCQGLGCAPFDPKVHSRMRQPLRRSQCQLEAHSQLERHFLQGDICHGHFEGLQRLSCSIERIGRCLFGSIVRGERCSILCCYPKLSLGPGLASCVKPCCFSSRVKPRCFSSCSRLLCIPGRIQPSRFPSIQPGRFSGRLQPCCLSSCLELCCPVLRDRELLRFAFFDCAIRRRIGLRFSGRCIC